MQIESEESLQKINAAVAAAEARTGAEIVPVVARCSGRYDRAEDIVGLWFAGILLAIVFWLFSPPSPEDAAHWGNPSLAWQLIPLLACLPVGFVFGAALASWMPVIRKLFTSRRQMEEEVYAKARAIFFDQRIHHTQSGAGVLLFVSLHEKMAAIVADEQVLAALGQVKLDSLCHQFSDRLRELGPSEALCATIDDLGKELSAPLPRAADDRNELADALVLIK